MDSKTNFVGGDYLESSLDIFRLFSVLFIINDYLKRYTPFT